MQPYPPLGTLYAAALLRQKGFSVALFDSMLENPEEGFLEAFVRTRPKVVAIYEDNFNFLSKMCLSRMRQIAFGMIEAARAGGCRQWFRSFRQLQRVSPERRRLRAHG